MFFCISEIYSFLLLSILCMCGQLLQSCLTLCDPLYCSLPGSSVPGISQARILEWSAMPSSRGSSQPRDQTRVSCLASRFFTHWATWEDSLSITPFIYHAFFNPLRERPFGPATSSLDLLWVDLLWTFLYNSIWRKVFSFLLGKHQLPISNIWMFWLLHIFTNTW